MDSANRRGFLKIAGAGAAAAGAASLVPLTTGTTTAGAAVPVARTTSLPAAAQGSMAAYIHDVSTGEIAVMVHGHEVTIVDHDLVARLATALHSAPTSL